MTVYAFYKSWAESATPTKMINQAITVIVEPICELTSFQNNPIVSTVLEKNYRINVGAEAFNFEIAYEPSSCNYIKSYVVTLNG